MRMREMEEGIERERDRERETGKEGGGKCVDRCSRNGPVLINM